MYCMQLQVKLKEELEIAEEVVFCSVSSASCCVLPTLAKRCILQLVYIVMTARWRAAL